MSRALVDEIVAEGGRHRARVFRRDDGLFEVEIERHFRDDGAGEPAHWSRVNRDVILADTAQRALTLAREALAGVP